MKASLLVKHEGEHRWRVPTVTAYKDEAALKLMLKEAPDLLPGEQDGRPIVVVDEFPVSFGSADLVGVSASGSITVVECKLRANPEIRRSIVGQLFAYASALWGMTYEEFDERWLARSGSSLFDHVAREAARHGVSWDHHPFAAAVAANLAAGRCTLIVAVDDITPELQRTIEYLSAHIGPDVDVIALELGYVADQNVEILVPQTYGAEMAERKRARRQWDEPSFLAALQQSTGEWATAIVRSLFDWARKAGLEVWYGAGPKVGTAMVGLRDRSGSRRAILGCHTSGAVEVEFQQLKLMPPFDSLETRRELLRRLNAIEGVRIPERMAETWPTVKLEALRGGRSLDQFQTALDWAIDQIERA